MILLGGPLPRRARLWALLVLGRTGYILLVIMTALIGLPVQPAAAASEVLLDVPYRSQLDDSPYAGANCGPASIAMVLGAYHLNVSTDTLRARVNDLQGTWGDYRAGTSPESIAAIVERYGLRPTVRRWTLDEVRAQLDAGVLVVP